MKMVKRVNLIVLVMVKFMLRNTMLIPVILLKKMNSSVLESARSLEEKYEVIPNVITFAKTDIENLIND